MPGEANPSYIQWALRLREYDLLSSEIPEDFIKSLPLALPTFIFACLPLQSFLFVKLDFFWCSRQPCPEHPVRMRRVHLHIASPPSQGSDPTLHISLTRISTGLSNKHTRKPKSFE